MCYLLAVRHEPDAPLVDAAQGYRTGMGLFQLAIEVRLAPVRSLLLLPPKPPSPHTRRLNFAVLLAAAPLISCISSVGLFSLPLL